VVGRRGQPNSQRGSRPERLLAVSRDVTEHKRNEEALHKAHLQVAKKRMNGGAPVFENSAIGVALTDLNGRFLATNPVYQIMVGYSQEELSALSFLDLTHPDHREANWALAAELLEGKRQQFQIEKQYRRKDGSLIWVNNNVSLVPGTETMPRFIMALSEDITERKRAEESLHNSEEQVRLILDSTAEGIFGCDPDGTCLFCNPAAARLLGYDEPSELLGKNMHALEHHTRPDGRPYPIEECPIYIGFQRGQGVHRDDEFIGERTGPAFRRVLVPSGISGGQNPRCRRHLRRLSQSGNRRKRRFGKASTGNAACFGSTNAIITNLDSEALQPALWAALHEYLQFDGAMLTLYHEDRDTLRVAAVETHLSISFVGWDRKCQGIASRLGVRQSAAAFSGATSKQSGFTRSKTTPAIALR